VEAKRIETSEPSIKSVGSYSAAAGSASFDLRSFVFRYDIMELNTAVKPFMFQHLLGMGHQTILYFDPDIQIFSRLDQILESLQDGASFVPTPHLCAPAEGSAYPDDIGILRAGVYNLGFLGVHACPEADSILAWWGRRLQYQCLDAQDIGIFVDQKFMDLVPGFAEKAPRLPATAGGLDQPARYSAPRS
jgi:hypothetical protein